MKPKRTGSFSLFGTLLAHVGVIDEDVLVNTKKQYLKDVKIMPGIEYMPEKHQPLSVHRDRSHNRTRTRDRFGNPSRLHSSANGNA